MLTASFLILRPIVAGSIDLFDHGLVAPGGGIRVDLLPLREINCNGSVEEKLCCVPSASLSDRWSGFLQRRTLVPTWHSHALGVGLYGYLRVLLEMLLSCSLLGFPAIAAELKDFRRFTWTIHCSLCFFAFGKHGCHVVMTSFSIAVNVLDCWWCVCA